MYDLKKDLKNIQNNDPSNGYMTYEAGKTKIGFGFNQVDTNSKSLSLQVKLYNAEGRFIATPQVGHLAIDGDRLNVDGTTEEVKGIFNEFYPEITGKGLALIKKLSMNGETVGDYLK